MGKYTEWQLEIIEREKTMTNRQLIENVLHLAGGDDYDGCFTDKGCWEYEYLKECLFVRLELAEWLE